MNNSSFLSTLPDHIMKDVVNNSLSYTLMRDYSHLLNKDNRNVINEIERLIDEEEEDQVLQLALEWTLLDLIYQYADTDDRMMKTLKFFIKREDSSIFEELLSEFEVNYINLAAYAFYLDKIDLVKYILRNTTLEDNENNKEYIIELFNEAQTLSFDLVRYLLENEYINIENVDIYDAVMFNNTSVVSYLIEKGANINYNDGYNELMDELAHRADMDVAYTPLLDYLRRLG